jgi:GR25 family glycosyltransferase involved in LPS biosynthesis
MESYKFAITYENAKAPGYVTEKLLHAKAAGCVPIYWGAAEVADDFDAGGFINAGSSTPRSQLEDAQLVAEVSIANADTTAWRKMASTPALTQAKVADVCRRFSQICKAIYLRISPRLAEGIPGQLECDASGSGSSSKAANSLDCSSSDSCSHSVQHAADNDALVKQTPKHASVPNCSMDATTPVCFTTYASARFLPQLNRWLSAAQRHRKAFQKSAVYIFFGADVPVERSNEYMENFPDVVFEYVPTATPADFPDLWAAAHYAWKPYVWYTLLGCLTNHLIFYSDAGSLLVRLPEAAAAVALEHGACIYEDATQANKFWCSAEFCKELRVTPEELEMAQPIAGIHCFYTGSAAARSLFEDAWTFSQKRNVITGPKWSGVYPNGQPFGHRHDQSILSILARRQLPAAAWRPMGLDVCEESLRRTFLTGASYYLYRTDFIQNRPFIGGITDAYVINLERRADRLEKFRTNNTAFQERVKRWPATDGRGLQLTPELVELFKPNDFFWKKAVMGCALSHLGIWRQLAEEPAEEISYLVFEDDARASAGFEGELARALPQVPANYDVLYLGGILPPNRELFKAVDQPVVPGSPWGSIAPHQAFGQPTPTSYFHFCNYGYVLSKRGARKILSLIEGRGGFFTSADHMICNHVDALNIYYLRSQSVGCIQEDDARYMRSDFNNFSRIDGFDSDLWTNDERFSEEERAAVPASAAAAAAAAAPASAHRFFIYSESAETPAFDKLLEVDWLSHILQRNLRTEPLQNIANIPSAHKFAEPPICIVQRPYMEHWQHIFQLWEKSKQPFVAIHLSDEFGTDPIDWYNFAMCKKVIRNYVRADAGSAIVVVVPLGYAINRQGSLQQPPLSSRKLLWSFEGTDWNGRGAKLAALPTDKPHKLTLRDNWAAANYPAADYNALLNDSQFVPCPGGTNAETYRFWEALEHGCIPIYVQEQADDAFWAWIKQHIPNLHAAESWSQMAEMMQIITANPAVADHYCADIQKHWTAWKTQMQTTLSSL